MRRLLGLLLLLSASHSLKGLATTVYKSTDDSGTVSFSDTRPENAPAVETLEITIPETPAAEASDLLQEMRKTTDKMAADRRERERHRAEMRQWHAEHVTQQYFPESAGYYGDVTSTYISRGSYYRYPIKHPWWHRPERPTLHPPLRPPHHKIPIGNFPAPHIRPLFTPRTRGAPRQ